MVKMYVVGLPETVCVMLFTSVNIALMIACTFCPEVPLYVQVRLNVASMPAGREPDKARMRSEEHTSELQSRPHLVCRILLENKLTRDWPPNLPDTPPTPMRSFRAPLVISV